MVIVKVVEIDEAIKLLSAGKLAVIDTKPALCKVIIFPVTDAINGLLELKIKSEVLFEFFVGSITSKL